jgi:hypothetical protein
MKAMDGHILIHSDERCPGWPFPPAIARHSGFATSGNSGLRLEQIDTPHAGGFLVALQDTSGGGKANMVERFGETVQSRGAGGRGR